MGSPLRVLIVEDSEDDAVLLLRELRRGGYDPIFKRVETPEAMSAELDGATWDIVISDYVMPRFNGLEALKLMQRKGLALPFMIVSGKADEDTLVRAMKAGVHDYILKRNLARLTPAVERELHEAATRRERIKAEEALRESEDKFRLITDNISDLVAQISADGRYLYVSPSYRKTLGFDPASLLGKYVDNYIHPEDLKRLVEVFNKGRAQSEDELKLEYRLHHRSGEYRWLEGAVKFLYDEKGNFSKVQVNSRDITGRKEMEEALRKSEEEARALAEENTVMAEIGRVISSTFDIDTVYERFSQEVRKIVPFDRVTINIIDYRNHTFTILYASGLNLPGRKKGTIVSLAGAVTEELIRTRRPLRIQEDEETQRKFPVLLPIFRAGFRSCLYIPMISQDKVIGVLSLLSTQPEAYTEKELRVAEEVGSQIAGAIANAQLYAERLRAEETLAQKTALLSGLLDSIPDRVFFKNLEGLYIGCNPEFARFVGRPREEIVGRTDYDLFPKEKADLYRETDRIMMERGDARRMESFIDYPDGGRLLSDTMKAPLRSSNGEVIGLVGVSRDITELKRAMEALGESERQAQGLARENAILAEISRIVSSSLSIEEVYKRFCDEVRKLLTFDWMVITLINKEENTLVIRYREGTSASRRKQGEAFPMEGTITAAVIQRRKGLIFHAQEEREVESVFPALLPDFRAGLRSTLCVPLISRDEVIGVLHFPSRTYKAYSERDLQLAISIANQIAGAIANAQLFAACRQAEEAVRKEKEKAHNYLNVAGAIIAVIESNQRISLINQRGCEVLEYEEGEIIGANWFDTFLPESYRDRMKAVFARCMVGEIEPVEYFENPILTKSGEEKIIAWHNTLLRNQAGTILGILSSGEDISERKRGEAEIRRLLRSVEQKRKELRALTIRLQEVEEAERRRLTQELHDRVGPNLTALSINLNIIQKELSAESSGKVGIRVEDSLKLLEETARHIRDVMAELRPPVIDDYGLLAALQWYGEQFTRRTGVPLVIRGAEFTSRLPAPLEIALFRVTQEALTNVARHARAGQVTVTMEELAQEVRLTIADDGTGFDFSSPSETRSGWGLVSMRERVEAIGGHFRVESAPGEGTRIVVAVRM